jgi:hypothetical protein
MIFLCPDCGNQIDTDRQMRRCGPYGHEPAVPTSDGTSGKVVEAKKPDRGKRDYQADFYQVGWNESQEPYSVRRQPK